MSPIHFLSNFINLSQSILNLNSLMPVWKVCIVRPRSRPRSFDVPYIFYSKFLKSRARNLQTFQSGSDEVGVCIDRPEWTICTAQQRYTTRNFDFLLYFIIFSIKFGKSWVIMFKLSSLVDW